MRSTEKQLRPKRDGRGSLQVRLFWMAFATVGLVLAGLAIVSSQYVDRSERTIVGRSEPVLLSSNTGELVLETTARLDTGADRSSIDRSIVDALGIDVTDAPTIRTSSALGAEERELVQISVELAGSVKDLEMSVSDRSERQFDVLLGVDALDGLVVDVDRDDSAPTTASDVTGTAVTDATDRLVNGDLPVTLLILLPLAAGIVVALRMVLGLQPLGTFAPVLLSLAMVRAGGSFVVLAGAALAATFAFQPLIVRLRVPRQARLAILIGVVVFVWLAVLGPTSAGLTQAQGIPVIVTVVVLDGLWVVLTDDGVKAAVRTTLHTAIAAFLVLAVIASSSVRVLALDHPYLVTVFGAALAAIAGSYRGLRLTEFVRFRRRPVAEEAVSNEMTVHVERDTMSALEYARLTGRSVVSIHRDCAIGRLDAEMVDSNWMIRVPSERTSATTELVGDARAR